MTPFDGDAAREIVQRELSAGKDDASEEEDVQSRVEKIDRPVAAASIGQVYKAQLPGRVDVAVKVQRPGVRQLVEVGRLLYLIFTLPCCMLHCPTETVHFTPIITNLLRNTQRDTELLLTVAKFLESLPALPSSNNNPNAKRTRLINTQLVSATQEFMSRIFEELDYRNEARNIQTFASLYSRLGGNSTDVNVVVPEVYMEFCTENVLGEWFVDGLGLWRGGCFIPIFVTNHTPICVH